MLGEKKCIVRSEIMFIPRYFLCHLDMLTSTLLLSLVFKKKVVTTYMYTIRYILLCTRGTYYMGRRSAFSLWSRSCVIDGHVVSSNALLWD